MPNFPSAIPEEYASHESTTDAYRDGWNHGHGIACHNVPKLGAEMESEFEHGEVTRENVRDYHNFLCHAAADHSRCYSPFEFTAREFNDAGEGDDDQPGSDDLWEAFEAGTADSISADLATYDDSDYGIGAESANQDDSDDDPWCEDDGSNSESAESTYVPNLDCMSIDNLTDYALARVASVDTDQRKLAAYANHKACAMLNRENGYIALAMESEAVCERIYESLPVALRW